jgi:uncharacterized protein (TIGR00290 family)
VKRVLLSWSSGKDCAWALHLLRQDPGIQVTGLFTTINEAFDRVAMHAVRRTLLEKQAAAAGLPLWTAPLPWPCSNEEYERRMAGVCARAVAAGIQAVAFGDLFLEDIRAYREKQLAPTGLEPLFPVWRRDTAALAREMIDAGVRAIVTCVDPRVLPAEFAGREWNMDFLRELPPHVDPCGENGEFHTFVFASPVFQKPVPVDVGEVVERDGFVFADVTTPAGSP